MSGLYIHVPFCQRICVYCDFYVTTARKWFGRYVDAVVKETAGIATHVDCWDTLYLGGGTPSYLPPEMMGRMLANIKTVAHAEVTLEANPNNITRENAAFWQSVGVNRLSIGVQSFDETELKFLTRNHSAQQAIDCVRIARESGIDNIGIDLIFGLPGQTPERWASTLETALGLKPEHLSIYNLTYEPGTPLHKWHLEKKLTERNDAAEESMFLAAHEMLSDAGYVHYEISNYGRPGFESAHNRSYWNGLPYVGLGPSAHSFDGRKRWWNVEALESYLERVEGGQSPMAEEEILSPEQRVMETILLGLRQAKGISMLQFNSAFGCDFREKYRGVLDRFEGLFSIDDSRAALTPQGWFIYDLVCRELAAVS